MPQTTSLEGANLRRIYYVDATIMLVLPGTGMVSMLCVGWIVGLTMMMTTAMSMIVSEPELTSMHAKCAYVVVFSFHYSR